MDPTPPRPPPPAPPGVDPATWTRLLVAHDHGRQGRFDDAEAAFRTALDAARDTDPRGAMLALHGLAITYGATGRLVEAEALAAAAADAARTLGDAAQLAKSLGAQVGALTCMDVLDGLDPLLDELEAALDRAPPGAVPWGRRELHEGRFLRALLRGELDDARRHLAAHEASGAGTRDAVDAVMSALFTARLETAAGRLDAAHAALARAEGLDAGRENVRLGVGLVAFHVARASGDVVEARHRAKDLLTALEASADDPVTCFDRLERGRVLGTALEALGDRPLAERAWDLAAAAAIERIVSLDAAARRLPELRLPGRQEPAGLVALRRVFLRTQGELCARVADRFRREHADLATVLGADRDGWVRVCAWCERLKADATTWLPVGEYVPRRGPLRVSHSICPACAAREGFV